MLNKSFLSRWRWRSKWRFRCEIDALTVHYVFCPADNSSSSTDTPSMAATALREFVERAVQEARKLPALGNSAANEKQDLNVTDRSYEDLLATAILNKVKHTIPRMGTINFRPIQGNEIPSPNNFLCPFSSFLFFFLFLIRNKLRLWTIPRHFSSIDIRSDSNLDWKVENEFWTNFTMTNCFVRLSTSFKRRASMVTAEWWHWGTNITVSTAKLEDLNNRVEKTMMYK